MVRVQKSIRGGKIGIWGICQLSLYVKRSPGILPLNADSPLLNFCFYSIFLFIYFQIRLNVDEMSVNISDFRFATASMANLFHRFATAADCISHRCSKEHRKGNFKVDISGTNFLLPNSIPYSHASYPPCVQVVYKGLMSSDGRQWSGYCGGNCGYCWPEVFRLVVEGC